MRQRGWTVSRAKAALSRMPNDNPDPFADVPYNEWTSCEVHGHDFSHDPDEPPPRACRDCGFEFPDDD